MYLRQYTILSTNVWENFLLETEALGITKWSENHKAIPKGRNGGFQKTQAMTAQ